MAEGVTNGQMTESTAASRQPNAGIPTMDEGSGQKRNLDTCLKVLASVQEQIRFADTKAAFVFAINTLMFGFLAGSANTIKKALAIAPVPAPAWVGLVALILFFACAVIAVGTLIYAVMSRFGALAPKSRVFFGHIATVYGKDYAKYVADVRGLTDDDWLNEVGTQIVETSHIAYAKHLAVRIAASTTLVFKQAYPEACQVDVREWRGAQGLARWGPVRNSSW